MKTIVLFIFLIFLLLNSTAQVKECYPKGFRKAVVPESLKNYRREHNGHSRYVSQAPLSKAIIPNVSVPSILQEDIVGCIYFDLQTYGSISNQIVVNPDGTIAIAWVNKPDANNITLPPPPSDGTAYGYFDGSSWLAFGSCMNSNLDSARTSSSNVVNTASGFEMIIADSAYFGTPFNHIVMARRIVKGTGPFTWTSPWGASSFDQRPKATSSGDNVYVIFNGSNNSAVVAGQIGPIYFSRSTNGGVSFSPKTIINLIDSNYYFGFRADNYSIDAKDSIVVIGFGSTYTDVGILKSTDYGLNWTKTIIQQHPIPMYVPDSITDINNDGIPDTLFTNGGDVKVLIDNNGMVHAWFSSMRYVSDTSIVKLYYTDGIEYWNENLGTNNYVQIAASIDYDGNGMLNFPVDTFTTCTNLDPFGYYDAGLSMLPSAGIDSAGKIYLSYSSIAEFADTTDYHMLHRHIYLMTLAPPYNVIDWTYPNDIIPLIADGGFGEHQEGVYACVARAVNNGQVCILYQRDDVPGTSIAPISSCSQTLNNGNASDIMVTKADAVLAGISSDDQNILYLSQNYPNPATNLTNIIFSLKKSDDILFEVYDLIGKVIYSEYRDNLLPGTHSIALNTSNFVRGIYTYSITTNEQKASRLMILQ